MHGQGVARDLAFLGELSHASQTHVHRHSEVRAVSAARRMLGPARRPSRAASRPPQGDGKKAFGAVAPHPHVAGHPDAAGHGGVHALRRRPVRGPLPSHGPGAQTADLRSELLLALLVDGTGPFDAASAPPHAGRHREACGHKGARVPLLSAPGAPQKKRGWQPPAVALRAELSLAPQGDEKNPCGAAAQLPRVQPHPVGAESPPRKGHGLDHDPSRTACRRAHWDGKNARRRDAAARQSACRRSAGGGRASLSLSTPFAA
jgi:hypothetical protein